MSIPGLRCARTDTSIWHRPYTAIGDVHERTRAGWKGTIDGGV